MKFAIIILFIFALFHIISYRFLIKDLIKNSKSSIKMFVLYLLFINYAVIIAYIITRQFNINHILFSIMSLSIFIMVMLFSASILNILFTIVSLFFKSLKSISVRFAQFTLLLSFIGFILGIYGAIKMPTITTQEIFINNLKSDINILQITDLHLSKLISKNKVDKIVELANSANADVIVLIGDIVDSYSNDVELFLPSLAKLKAKYGIYFALGNHEFIFNPYESIEFIKKAGINTLINSNVVINDNINLIGLSDLSGHRYGYLYPDFKESVKNINSNLPNVLLAHQPNAIYLLESNIDLMLSGHTHGGQIFPFHLFAYLGNPFLYGLKTINGTQVYISRGASMAVTFARLFSDSEINLIKLRRGNE